MRTVNVYRRILSPMYRVHCRTTNATTRGTTMYLASVACLSLCALPVWGLVLLSGQPWLWFVCVAWMYMRGQGDLAHRFFTGTVEGQLVTLVKKDHVAGESTYEAFGAMSGATLLVDAMERRLLRHRPRGFLTVPVRVGDKTLSVINTHLSQTWDHGARRLACQAMWKSGAHVIAGDFNASPGHVCPGLAPTYVHATQHAKTWDLTQPWTRRTPHSPRTMQLDYIFARDMASRAATCIRTGTSDHYAVMTSFDIYKESEDD